jgi:Capsule polysaccharide biosynthesis protein
VDTASELFQLRMQRNMQATRAALAYLQTKKPDVVLIPNGTITELGVVYYVARYLGIRTVTYEFNDQREQVWIAQDDEVMRQRTDELWVARGNQKLTDEQRNLIEELESARMGAKAFGKSARKWQDVEAVGGEQIRKELGLDERPVILLATNVLGDSLTLGRNVFAKSMAAWIAETVRFLAGKPGVQLVMRVHPGERLTHGRSMVDVVKEALPSIPEHIHIIGPLEKVNTYDLMDIASLGLVYTTTTGMEMAMNGIPVIACGETHYAKRGFTLDPQSWGEYYDMLDTAIREPKHLTQKQIKTAWEYAYRFFFEYPLPFPWRLMHFWKDLDIWPLDRVLSEEGRAEYKKTFDYLAGEPIKW